MRCVLPAVSSTSCVRPQRLPCAIVKGRISPVVALAQGNGNGARPGLGQTSSQQKLEEVHALYDWKFSKTETGDFFRSQVLELPVAAIRRPLGKNRSNDNAKVEALMVSIKEIGLQEPIDVLLVDDIYYGFSGCHRYEAHKRLGKDTILCRVRKATQTTLRMHLA